MSSSGAGKALGKGQAGRVILANATLVPRRLLGPRRESQRAFKRWDALARCVDGAIWGKPVQDRHCPATVTPLGVAPAAKSDHPTRRVRRPSRERERTLHGALAARKSP
jgi:hypothetical protein